jgi:four helix bundle protein
MTEPLGHEKLIVYQKGMRFAVLRGVLLERLSRRVAACDHLDRGAESILLNIAEGNGRFSGHDQAVFYETAFKATIQSASLVDLATAGGVADVARAEAGRELLRRIAAMLTALSKVAAHA